VISNYLTRGIAAATAFLAFMFITAAHAETRHYFCKEEVRYDSDSKPTKITNGAAVTFTAEKGWFSSSVKMNDNINFNFKLHGIGETTVFAIRNSDSLDEFVQITHTSPTTADFTNLQTVFGVRGLIAGTCTFQIK